jgi:chemotaxis signal transduction protein
MLILTPGSLQTPATKLTIPQAAARPAQLAAAASEAVVLLFRSPALLPCAASRFALSARRIAAVTQPMPCMHVPGSVRAVKGVAWWRDMLVPVLDFRGPGEHGDVADRRRYVIAQCGRKFGSAVVAIPVDVDVTMYRPRAEDRRTNEDGEPAFVAGTFDVDGEAVALLDLDAVIAKAIAEA